MKYRRVGDVTEASPLLLPEIDVKRDASPTRQPGMDWPRTNNDNHSVDFQYSPSGLYCCQTGSLQRRRGRRGTQIFPKWGAVVNQVFARPEWVIAYALLNSNS
jgi:hypothetical protein